MTSKSTRFALQAGQGLPKPQNLAVPRTLAPAPHASCLVLAAWRPELKRLHSLLRRTPSPNVRIATALVGVGMVEAAAGAARAIAQTLPSHLVLLGTAGVFEGAPFEPPQAVWAQRLELGVVDDDVRAQIPAPMPRQVTPSASWGKAVARAAGLPSAQVACPLAITRDPVRARTLSLATGTQLENLEAFAVARAAAHARVPLAVILGVANTVGPSGQAQWRAHGDAAAAAACDAFWAWVLAQPTRA